MFHMLRTMMKDAAASQGGRKDQSSGNAEEPFVRALRKVRERYEGKSISTSQLLDGFSEDLPPALRYVMVERSDALRVQARATTSSQSVETLEMSFPLVDADSATLQLQWGTFVLPLRVHAR